MGNSPKDSWRGKMDEKDRVILEALDFLIKETIHQGNYHHASMLLSRIEVLLGDEPQTSLEEAGRQWHGKVMEELEVGDERGKKEMGL
jgi:hypothetical protein